MTFNETTAAASTAAAAALENELDSAIGDLKAAASGFFEPSLSQTGFDNNPTWSVDRGREVALSGLNDLPADRPALNIPTFSYNPGDLFPPDLTSRYGYDSDFFDNFLDAKLREFIDSPTTFISEDVQDAIFDQTRERDLQTLNDALDAVDRRQGRRGFPLLTSMSDAARDVVIDRYTNTKDDRNKEETALIADKAQQEQQHSIDAGIKMEDIRSRFQLESANLYWRASDYLVKQFESEVRAEIARFNGELDLVKADTSVKQGMAGFDQAYEQMDQAKELARLQGHVTEMTGNIDTWKQQFVGRIEAAAKAAGYYSSAVNSWLNQVNAINYEDTSA